MRTKKQLIACGLSFALLFGMIPDTQVSAAKKISLSAGKLTVTKGKSKTLKVKNAKKTVKWKILSGKTYITLKKKSEAAVTIKGRKKGTAKVQAAVGKTKLTCKVTVKNATKQNTPKPVTTKAPVSTTSTQPAVTSAPTGTQTPPATSTQPTETNAPTGTQTPPAASAQPTETNAPTDNPTGSHETDVENLTALIAQQRGRGAIVSENLDSDEYIWENGRLTGIEWWGIELSGDLDVSGLDALKSLQVGNNYELSSLNVTKNVQLVKLDVGSNKLSSLDVSNCVNLKELNCRDNPISSLDVSKCVNLEILYCNAMKNTQLAELDLTNNVKLKTLWCMADGLSRLDVSKCVNLEELDCWGNQISNLDVSNCINLKELNCASNQISSLDVSNCVNLEEFNCRSNQISSLDLRNINLKFPNRVWDGCDDTVTFVKDEQDVAALNALIAELRGRGITVSEDLDSGQYYWIYNGRLDRINWCRCDLSGDLDLSGLSALTEIVFREGEEDVNVIGYNGSVGYW